MQGRDNDEDPARAYPGNRPSTTLLLDDVTPEILGALIAFYEQRTFVNAVLMGINPFDQFGVELGKDIARSIEKNGPQDFDPSTMALIQLALARSEEHTSECPSLIRISYTLFCLQK